MANLVVHKQVQLNATPAAVWDALTNPEKTKKIFFNCRVLSDWKAGSPILFKGKMFLFFPIELHGKIVEVVPQQLLKYTLVNEKDGSTSVITDRISHEGSVTFLSVSDDVGPGKEAEARYKRSVIGWDKILKGLKKLVEK